MLKCGRVKTLSFPQWHNANDARLRGRRAIRLAGGSGGCARDAMHAEGLDSQRGRRHGGRHTEGRGLRCLPTMREPNLLHPTLHPTPHGMQRPTLVVTVAAQRQPCARCSWAGLQCMRAEEGCVGSTSPPTPFPPYRIGATNGPGPPSVDRLQNPPKRRDRRLPGRQAIGACPCWSFLSWASEFIVASSFPSIADLKW